MTDGQRANNRIRALAIIAGGVIGLATAHLLNDAAPMAFIERHGDYALYHYALGANAVGVAGKLIDAAHILIGAAAGFRLASPIIRRRAERIKRERIAADNLRRENELLGIYCE